MDGRASPGEELWRVASDLNRAAARVDPRADGLPPLIFMTDPDRTPRPWRTAARLPAGAAVIHRGFGRAEAADEAARLREVTAGAGVRLLIAVDDALAVAVGADGLHLPQRDLARAEAVRAAHPGWLITGALHPPASAATFGLDAVLISPVFAAGGASSRRPELGVEELARAVSEMSVPAYALGGIGTETAHQLAGTGVCGVAAVEAVLRAFAD